MLQVSEIKMYAITQRFITDKGTSAFAGHIYASSMEEAGSLAKKIGAELDGEMVESICANCGKTEIFNNSDFDIWSDLIE